MDCREIQWFKALVLSDVFVYIFYNEKDTTIYIGKAKRLKNRVSSYFNKVHEQNKTKIMVRQIARMEHIVVESETDSLLLENNLIKKYQLKVKQVMRLVRRNLQLQIVI